VGNNSKNLWEMAQNDCPLFLVSGLLRSRWVDKRSYLGGIEGGKVRHRAGGEREWCKAQCRGSTAECKGWRG